MGFTLDPESSKSRQDDDDSARDSARAHVLSLLDMTGGDADARLSFAEVINQHESLQTQWNSEVSEDLVELGVNVQTSFRLMYDPAGVVTVAGNHSDREMIDAYFSANPARVEELGDILAMGKLASAARAGFSGDELTQSFSREAMASWYADNLPSGSLSSGGGLLFGADGAVYRGLDIRV